MELQRVNVLSLAPREQKKKDVLHTEPESVRERLQETNDRLSQPVKAFKIERSKISSACFDLERLVVFVGLTTGRIGVWYRDPSKFGNIEDVGFEALTV